ncbi:MAG: general secretion pathway protein GspB [Ramlibacter sp.]|nr:general secretion pathway protein GspB [Ramlibacter sp.]
MSYILDALKRADAERERGQVPGLHAQPMPVTAEQRTGMAAPWRWLIGAAVVVALAGVSWQVSQRETAAPGVVAVAPPPPPPATATPAPVPPTAPAPTPVPPPAPAAPATADPAPPVTPPAQPRPKPKAQPPQPAKKQPRPEVTKPAPPVAPEPKVYAINELPQDVRRDLPKLNVTGSVYSANPAQRMLILNGQVFNEGGHPAPDSVIERIGPHSAVMSFRGMRYALTY